MFGNFFRNYNNFFFNINARRYSVVTAINSYNFSRLTARLDVLLDAFRDKLLHPNIHARKTVTIGLAATLFWRGCQSRITLYRGWWVIRVYYNIYCFHFLVKVRKRVSWLLEIFFIRLIRFKERVLNQGGELPFDKTSVGVNRVGKDSPTDVTQH